MLKFISLRVLFYKVSGDFLGGSEGAGTSFQCRQCWMACVLVASCFLNTQFLALYRRENTWYSTAPVQSGLAASVKENVTHERTSIIVRWTALSLALPTITVGFLSDDPFLHIGFLFYCCRRFGCICCVISCSSLRCRANDEARRCM